MRRFFSPMLFVAAGCASSSAQVQEAELLAPHSREGAAVAAGATEPACPSASALTSSILALASQRDEAGLEALRGCAREDAGVLARFARAMYWTGGVRRAQADLAAVCADDRVPRAAPERARACATLAFAELAGDRPLNAVRAAGEAPFLPEQSLFIALVSVNQLPPEPFIVDTGAPTTVISRRYADRTGLAYRADLAEHSADASGNAVALHPSVLDSMRWGEVEVNTVPVHVLALPENFRVGGILAPQDMLRGTSFEIDGPARVLRVPSPGAAPSPASGSIEVPLLWSGGNAFVTVRVDELEPLPFLLDSGAGGMGLCEEMLAKHGKQLAGGELGQSATAAGHAAVRTGLEASIAVGNEPPRAFSFFVQGCPKDADASIEKAGYVGAPWFWERRVYFPEHRRHISFAAAQK